VPANDAAATRAAIATRREDRRCMPAVVYQVVFDMSK
jgi:hypothetical protein